MLLSHIIFRFSALFKSFQAFSKLFKKLSDSFKSAVRGCLHELALEIF